MFPTLAPITRSYGSACILCTISRNLGHRSSLEDLARYRNYDGMRFKLQEYPSRWNFRWSLIMSSNDGTLRYSTSRFPTAQKRSSYYVYRHISLRHTSFRLCMTERPLCLFSIPLCCTTGALSGAKQTGGWASCLLRPPKIQAYFEWQTRLCSI